MRWEKKLKKRQEQPIEYMSVKDFKKYLFRFLKEFGYYRSYINDMKKYNMKRMVFTHEGIMSHIVTIPFDEYISLFGQPITRYMFPCSSNPMWEKIYDLWRIWAKEQHKISWSTKFK